MEIWRLERMLDYDCTILSAQRLASIRWYPGSTCKIVRIQEARYFWGLASELELLCTRFYKGGWIRCWDADWPRRVPAQKG
jgi:hypothetical protein